MVTDERPFFSSSVSAGAALWAYVVPLFAGASSESLKCADAARFVDPEVLIADADCRSSFDALLGGSCYLRVLSTLITTDK
jgi:hypothetical protein